MTLMRPLSEREAARHAADADVGQDVIVDDVDAGDVVQHLGHRLVAPAPDLLAGDHRGDGGRFVLAQLGLGRRHDDVVEEAREVEPVHIARIRLHHPAPPRRGRGASRAGAPRRRAPRRRGARRRARRRAPPLARARRGPRWERPRRRHRRPPARRAHRGSRPRPQKRKAPPPRLRRPSLSAVRGGGGASSLLSDRLSAVLTEAEPSYPPMPSESRNAL